MASVLIRKLPDDTLAAFKQRARSNGRSTAAEIREVLVREMIVTRDATPFFAAGYKTINPWTDEL